MSKRTNNIDKYKRLFDGSYLPANDCLKLLEELHKTAVEALEAIPRLKADLEELKRKMDEA